MRVLNLRRVRKECQFKNFVLLGVDEKAKELVIFDHDLYVLQSLVSSIFIGKLECEKIPVKDFRVLNVEELKIIETALVKNKVTYQIVYFYKRNIDSAALGNHMIYDNRSYNYFFYSSFNEKSKNSNIINNKVTKVQATKNFSNNKINNYVSITKTITVEKKGSLHINAKTSKWYESDLSRIVRTDKSSLDSELADAKLHKKRSYTDKYIDDQPTSGEMWSARMNEFNK